MNIETQRDQLAEHLRARVGRIKRELDELDGEVAEARPMLNEDERMCLESALTQVRDELGPLRGAIKALEDQVLEQAAS